MRCAISGLRLRKSKPNTKVFEGLSPEPNTGMFGQLLKTNTRMFDRLSKTDTQVFEESLEPNTEVFGQLPKEEPESETKCFRRCVNK